MKGRNILEELKLEMENSMPQDILKSVKKQRVQKDLTPIYDEINDDGSVSFKSNVKIIASFMGITLIFFVLLIACLPIINKLLHPEVNIVSKLGIDINPSIDLMLDENDNVVLCLAKNRHAQLLLEGENFIGKPAGEVTNKIITLATKAGYISTEHKANEVENAVLISAIAENEEKEDKLLDSMETVVNNFYIKNQIYGVVLKQFASKQELVDLVKTLDYDRAPNDCENLKNYSVKNLTKILSDSYTQLRRRFRSDFIIEEISKHIAPIYEEYEQSKAEIDLKLQELEHRFENFEQIWKDEFDLCQQKIAFLKDEILQIKEKLKTEINKDIIASLNADLKLKQEFLESEEKELKDREKGSEAFNGIKDALFCEIIKFRNELLSEENNYLIKVEAEIGKTKADVKKLDSQIENKKQYLLQTHSQTFNNHLNSLQSADLFNVEYSQWLEDVASIKTNMEDNWSVVKLDWKEKFAEYINF